MRIWKSCTSPLATGTLEELKRLVNIGVDPTIANRFGCTALHLACKAGHVECAAYLSSVGDVSTEWHGQKPIHLAVLSNSIPLVKALVEGSTQAGRSAEILLNDCDDMLVTEVGTHLKTSKGQAPLHWCVGLGEAYFPMLQLLLSLGASPTCKDKEGETPIMRALEFHNDPALEALLSARPAASLQLHMRDADGRTHLHWAILANNEPVALRLLELGHDCNIEDEQKVVPLYLAVAAAMVTLVTKILEEGDPFLLQNAPFHNGTTILPDRIQWTKAVTESEEDPEVLKKRKQQTVQLLQQKLDSINEGLRPAGETGEGKKKRSASAKKMNLAPSAPVRSRSKSKGAKK
ncbi:hypothetical protein AGDE_11876 [Angomonas deanei]|nr:hypothetical protein AGDE_11876 [Angomonas deanei]|eukprot:EPY25331.1 hypothetical protein AGDE_11876 [Angomonas deanei]